MQTIALTAKERLSECGIDAIAARIESGETQREIAESFGFDTATLNRWLHADPQRSARAQAAMLEAAESLQDRGHQALVDAAGGSQADVALARALDQHWARRAAIRNPAHRERSEVTHSGQMTHAVATMTLAQLEQIAAQGLPMAERVEGGGMLEVTPAPGE